MEALINPKIKLGEWFVKLLARYGTEDSPSLTMIHFARLPAIIHKPEENIAIIENLHKVVGADLKKTKPVLETFTSKAESQNFDDASVKIMTRIQSRYGTLLTCMFIVTRMLINARPKDTGLIDELSELSTEAIELAHAADPYRPLGSSYMPSCLIVACAAAIDKETRTAFENLLEDWRTDFTAYHWQTMVRWLRGRFDRAYRKLSGLHEYAPSKAPWINQMPPVGDGPVVRRGPPACTCHTK